MIDVIKSDKVYGLNQGWLKTKWLFSFDNYYDPNNVHFGNLRVFNDDIVMPSQGFDMHSHFDMEIITIVLDGEITHKDNLKNKENMKSGDVQRIYAGTGIVHSEFNEGKKPLHLYQIWVKPNIAPSKAKYSYISFKPSSWKNTLLPIASGFDIDKTIKLNADVNIYRSTLDVGKAIDYATGKRNKVFIYVKNGSLDVNAINVYEGDQARIENVEFVSIVATGVEPCEFVMVESY